jgi:SAM-dependent methyltransferase
MITQKILYLLWAAHNYRSKKTCPSCGSCAGNIIDRKYIFTSLIECRDCHLYYRHPIENPQRAKKFYESNYTQDDGITTKLPDISHLNHWMANNFCDSPKNATVHLSVITNIFPDLKGKKIVDYGASWGYTSFQFKAAGMLVNGYEMSNRRASYAQRLGLDIKVDETLIPNENDIFYSSHVLEHVPSIPRVVEIARKVLKRNGVFIAFFPNGSEEFRKISPKSFHSLWGLVHPNYLNPEYLANLFADVPYYIQSSPYNGKAISEWKDQQIIAETDGDELMVIVKVNQKIKQQ